MGDRFAALAGYAGDETVATDYNRTGPGGLTMAGLDTTDDSSIAPAARSKPSSSAPRPLSPRKSNVPTNAPSAIGKPVAGARTASGSNVKASRVPLRNDSATEPSTPQAAIDKRAHKSRAEVPATDRKQDPRKLQGIRIVDGEDSVAPYGEVDDTGILEDSDADFIRAQQDLSRANETSLANGTSLEESAIGLTEAQAEKARRAAGLSMKVATERNDQLTKENNDLKIEVDLLRQRYKHSDNDVMQQLVSITQEHRRLQARLAKQDQFIREAGPELAAYKKLQRRIGKEDPVALRAEAQRAQAEAEEHRSAREALEEELADVRNQSEEAKADLEAERQDHQSELYTRQQEIADLEDQIEQLQERAETHGRTDAELEEIREQLDALQAENKALTMELDQLQAKNSDLEGRVDDLDAENADLAKIEGELQRELDQVQRRLADVVDERGADEQHHQQQIVDEVGAATQALRIQYEADINALRDEGNAEKVRVEELEATLDDYEHRMDEQLERIEHLELENQNTAKALAESEAELDELLREKSELESLLATKETQLNNTESARQAAESYLEEKTHQLQQSDVELSEAAGRLSNAEERIERLNADLDEARHDTDELLQNFGEERDRYVRKIQALRERLEDRDRQIEALQAQADTTQHDMTNGAEVRAALSHRVEQLEEERDDLREETAKLHAKLEDMLSDLRTEEQEREDEAQKHANAMEDLQDQHRRLVDEKEADISSIEAELESSKKALQTCKADLQTLQSVLRNKEMESDRLGKTHSTDRHSLELEIDRLKRDLTNCESDLERSRKDLDRKEDALRDKEAQLSQLHADIRTLNDRVAKESSGKSSLDEKLESKERAIAAIQAELDDARVKVTQLEEELNDGERSMMQDQQQIRNQLTERNTLLLNVYQFMGKILSADRLGGASGPRKSGANDSKPFTNFAIFHDNLTTRMHRLSDIQGSFAERVKTIEGKFTEQFSALKRQQDSKFRQLDRCEVSIKTASDKSNAWRARMVAKQSELDLAKTTAAELQTQLTSFKTRSNLASTGENSKMSDLTSRAMIAERKLKKAQDDLHQCNERLVEEKKKSAEDQGNSSAQIKELKMRYKKLEERLKSERQGAKERVSELEAEMKRLKQQELAGTQKRRVNVGNLHDALKGAGAQDTS
ncbi:Extracellular matrix glycoprotein Laminin subunits alpha and gamma [Ceraceosorus bombacis]|uniref:Extracellular matrix glycoprotein Laminin subunits alpha and gamma n=1 Tax=Ceraceosorus bombacis TaxID=401625 RepID=A0A0P1BMI9_9BASI|nr:Extracellular matrix glycoprotein Laminin subunits alpha and gamma [Ceraceosorus bombacis]